jgi:ABC-type multidrug transport system fused ATPase/permease subunit
MIETMGNRITLINIIKNFTRENLILTISYLIVLVIWPFHNIAIPHLIGKLYKAINANNEGLLSGLVLLMLALVVAQVFTVVASKLDALIFPKIQKFTRDMIMKHTFDSKSGNYSEAELGSVITQTIKMPMTIYGLVNILVYNYLPALTLSLFAIIYITYYDTFLGVVMLMVMLLIYWSFLQTFDSCSHLAIHRDETINSIYKRIDDTLRNMKTVVGFGYEEHEMTRINVPHANYADLTLKNLACASRNMHFAYVQLVAYIVFVCAYYMNYMNLTPFVHDLDKAALIAIILILFILMKHVGSACEEFKDVMFKWGTMQNSLKIFHPEIDVVREETRYAVKDDIDECVVHDTIW